MHMIQMISAVAFATALLAAVTAAAVGLRTKKKKWKAAAGICLLLCVFMACLYFVLAVKQYSDFSLEETPEFAVTSPNLNDGVWEPVITNTEYGQNRSPELDWQEVPGTAVYVIYMLDSDAGNWMHMKAENIAGTSLSEGGLPDDSYIGPSPPSGTHRYEIYVFALGQQKDTYPGQLDHVSAGIEELALLLDVRDDGAAGNVIAYGKLSGTYTHGDR